MKSRGRDWRALVLCNNELYAIQRISDGKIFTIGDIVRINIQTSFENTFWKIDKFTTEEYVEEDIQIHFKWEIKRKTGEYKTWLSLRNIINRQYKLIDFL